MYWQGYWGSLVPGALLLIWWSWSLFIRSLLRTLCGFRGKCLSLLMVLLLPARWVDPRTNVWRVYSEILFSCLHSPLMLLEILFRSVGPNLKSNQILQTDPPHVGPDWLSWDVPPAPHCDHGDTDRTNVCCCDLQTEAFRMSRSFSPEEWSLPAGSNCSCFMTIRGGLPTFGILVKSAFKYII